MYEVPLSKRLALDASDLAALASLSLSLVAMVRWTVEAILPDVLVAEGGYVADDRCPTPVLLDNRDERLQLLLELVNPHLGR